MCTYTLSAKTKGANDWFFVAYTEVHVPHATLCLTAIPLAWVYALVGIITRPSVMSYQHSLVTARHTQAKVCGQHTQSNPWLDLLSPLKSNKVPAVTLSGAYGFIIHALGHYPDNFLAVYTIVYMPIWHSVPVSNSSICPPSTCRCLSTRVLHVAWCLPCTSVLPCLYVYQVSIVTCTFGGEEMAFSAMTTTCDTLSTICAHKTAHYGQNQTLFQGV